MTDDDTLAWICSSVTLQSEKRGYFTEFLANVTEAGGDGFLNDFGRLKIDKDRILFCLNHKKVRDIVRSTLSNVQKLHRTKHESFAREKHMEAEHYASKKHYTRALAAANIAVVRMPVEAGTQLAEALWLRSMVLYELQEYKLCLVDVQMALKYKLEDRLKLEAYQRMLECYIQLKDKKKAKIAATIVVKMCKLEGGKVAEAEAEKRLSDVENMEEEAESTEEIELYEGESKGLPDLSSCLSMKKSESKGRYIVANSNIPIGSIIAAEEPYSAVLRFEKQGSNCLHCFAKLKSPIPCTMCSGVGFCSNNCASSATYHKYECPFVELMIGSGMSVATQLSLRLVSQTPITEFLAFIESLKDPSAPDSPYLKLYSLETHSKTRSAKDFLGRTLMALLLFQILRESGYFGPHGSLGFDNLTTVEVTVACLLLHHLQLTQYNAHEIYESFVVKKDATTAQNLIDLNKCKLHYIAVGIYPSSCLLNHSCEPACSRYFIGKKLILRTTKPLAIGMEVPENYGPSFINKKKFDRLKILNARYRFVCDCTACVGDYPLPSEVSEYLIRFKCSNLKCSGVHEYRYGSDQSDWICTKCAKKVKLKDQLAMAALYQKDFEVAYSLMMQRRDEEAATAFMKYIEDAHVLLCQPNKSLCTAMEALRNIWASKSNFYYV